MTGRWVDVSKWLEYLQTHPPDHLHTGLSPQGVQLGVDLALSQLNSESLAVASSIKGMAYTRATLVMARTVFTAPLEWAAVLLGRGSSVLIKVPEQSPNAANWLTKSAALFGLSLTASTDRSSVEGADLVIAMGSDKTIAQLSKQLQNQTAFFGFGHKFSAAYITDPDSWLSVATAIAAYDSRGCMSPVAVFTPLDRTTSVGALSGILSTLEQKWPRGQVSSAELASIRQRTLLATVVGEVSGENTARVFGLPEAHFKPTTPPRCATVIQVDSAAQAARILSPYAAQISTIATDEPSTHDLFRGLGARVVEPDAQQSPRLDRWHDGIDLLRATIRTED